MIVVGLNGGCSSVIERGIQNGTLESFQRLSEEGTGGDVWSLTTSPPAQWSAHLTGVFPEEGGVNGYLSTRRIQWGIGLARTEDLKVKTYPELLDEAGIPVGLVNLPPTYPPLELEHGFSVSGMLTPADAEDYMHPPSLSDRLEDYRIGVHYDDLTVTPFGDPVHSTPDPDLNLSLEDLREDVLEVENRRLEAVLELLDRENPEVMVVLVSDLDVLHFFTHHELTEGAGENTALFRLYRRIDRFLGQLMQRYPKRPLLVFSGHGYRPVEQSSVLGRIGKRLRNFYGYLHPEDFLGGRADLLADLRGTLGRWIPERVKQTAPYARLYETFRRLAGDAAPGDAGLPDRPRGLAQTGVRDRRGFWRLRAEGVRPGESRDLRFLDLTVLVMTLLDQPVPARYEGSLPGNAAGSSGVPRLENVELSVDRGDVPPPNQALRRKVQEELGG